MDFLVDTVTIVKLNDIHLKIVCEPSIRMEMSEYFTFFVPGYKHMPKFKNGSWDGKIRLLNLMNGLIYVGLLHKIIKFCMARGYKIDIDPSLIPKEDIPDNIAYGLAELYNTKYPPRDYQNTTVYHALKEKRAIFLSATSSGKSFSIYLTTRFLVEAQKQVLIIVPTKALVRQMATDFIDYNHGNMPFTMHQIEGGVDKNINAQVIISTWQSIYKQPKTWFDKFEAIIGDECHEFKAKSLIEIMEKTPECEYKLGFTGTLDGTECNELVLTGLFGRAIDIVDAATLINNGTLVEFKIDCVILKHGETPRKVLRKKDYATEMSYVISHTERNNFIRDLSWALKGNTLILTQSIEQGKHLADICQKEGKQVLFVSGKDSTDYRDEVRKITELNNDVIIIATYGVFQRGINIVNLDNLILGTPSKSKIRILQSIGRVLRKSANNTKAMCFDIADDISSESYLNHGMRHFKERIDIYNEQGFDYKIRYLNLKDMVI
jgi:superfamily II DNA or RNA helicase